MVQIVAEDLCARGLVNFTRHRDTIGTLPTTVIEIWGALFEAEYFRVPPGTVTKQRTPERSLAFARESWPRHCEDIRKVREDHESRGWI